MYHVPVLSIVFMFISCICAFAMPVVLFIYFRTKKKAEILPFFVGCGVMFLFSFVIESTIHQVVFRSPAGTAIQGNILLYALYGGLMAGIFEECGRFIAFRTVLKRYLPQDPNALMYGAGHGGIEAIVLLGIAMINNMIYSILLNLGQSSVLTGPLPPELAQQVEGTFEKLATLPPGTFLLGLLERVLALTLQIALSVIVWFAAKRKERRMLLPAAIFIHFMVDAVAVIIAEKLPALAVEGFIAVMDVPAVLFAYFLWKAEKKIVG